MLVLWERESMIVKDLGTALQLDTGTLSPLLKRMESNGLISRRRRHDDERSVDVTPTEHGWALQDRARSVPTRLVTTLDLTGAELAELRDTLHRITATALDHLVGAVPRRGAE
jgi:DNA-binding MarR family transcriptional regulator